MDDTHSGDNAERDTVLMVLEARLMSFDDFQHSAENISTFRLARIQPGQMKGDNESIVWQWKRVLDSDGGITYTFS